MRLIDADKIHWEYKCISKEEIDDEPTVKAIPIEWIEKYIWRADTHEEKRALRKMYIAWEKENEAD